VQERWNRAETCRRAGSRRRRRRSLALAALAFAIGRRFRDPSPGGPFLILMGATIRLLGCADSCRGMKV
jgi:hypothetical protein